MWRHRLNLNRYLFSVAAAPGPHGSCPFLRALAHFYSSSSVSGSVPGQEVPVSVLPRCLEPLCGSAPDTHHQHRARARQCSQGDPQVLGLVQDRHTGSGLGIILVVIFRKTTFFCLELWGVEQLCVKSAGKMKACFPLY